MPHALPSASLAGLLYVGATAEPGRLAVLWRDGPTNREVTVSRGKLIAWAGAQGPSVARHVRQSLQQIDRSCQPFAGLSLDRPRLMGIINVTPDSFSDGGRWLSAEAAIAHGQALLAAGADILDVGGESTRPGATALSPDEEMARVLPVVKELAAQGALVSIDSRHSAVMAAAIAAGARIVNDISALSGDGAALQTVADSDASVVLMHMQGDPQTMQSDPRYRCAPLDVYDYLAARLAVCRSAGLADHRLCIDPGIGFGKSLQHNLQILARLGLYRTLGVPVLLGVSRKRFIAGLSRGEDPDSRLAGSLAAALAGVRQGVQILRVHDVAETRQALAVWQAIG